MPPLVIEDAGFLLSDPQAAVVWITAPLKLEPWREAIARTALCRAVEAL
jgi:hypothetical protein